MTLISTDAIVLHVQDYLESSRIIRLATREHGAQSVLARGARRAKSRFGPSLDLFAGGVAHFTLKPGRELSTLTGFDLTRSRLALAENLDRFAGASVLAEMALRFSHADPDPHDDAFDVLGRSLDEIAESRPGDATDRALASRQGHIDSAGGAARRLKRRALLVERGLDFRLQRVDELAELGTRFGSQCAERLHQRRDGA